MGKQGPPGIKVHDIQFIYENKRISITVFEYILTHQFGKHFLIKLWIKMNFVYLFLLLFENGSIFCWS